MPITIDGSAGISGATTGAFSGNVTANGLSTELRPLVLGTAKTATGTAVDFTGIPSWVKRITVILDNVSTNGTSIDLLQLGDSGGIETSGYAGASGYVANGAVAVAVTAQTAGFGLTSTKTAASSLYATITLTLRDNTNTWVFGMTGTMVGGAACFLGGGGSKTLSGTLDRVRITTVNGTDTFDAGTINIMYE